VEFHPEVETGLEPLLLRAIQEYRTGMFSEQLDVLIDLAERLARKPSIARARRLSGLARYEKEERRCVYLEGDPKPHLAWKVPGEPEYDERIKLIAKAQELFSVAT